MPRAEHLIVGDTFRCARFATEVGRRYVQRRDRRPGVFRHELVFAGARRIGWTEVKEIDGEIHRIERVEDLSADDESRGTAVFRVCEAEMKGGGNAFDGPYPDGWHVTAERLGGPKETVSFCQSHWFRNCLPASDIELVPDPESQPSEPEPPESVEEQTAPRIATVLLGRCAYFTDPSGRYQEWARRWGKVVSIREKRERTEKRDHMVLGLHYANGEVAEFDMEEVYVFDPEICETDEVEHWPGMPPVGWQT